MMKTIAIKVGIQFNLVMKLLQSSRATNSDYLTKTKCEFLLFIFLSVVSFYCLALQLGYFQVFTSRASV